MSTAKAFSQARVAEGAYVPRAPGGVVFECTGLLVVRRDLSSAWESPTLPPPFGGVGEAGDVTIAFHHSNICRRYVRTYVRSQLAQAIRVRKRSYSFSIRFSILVLTRFPDVPIGSCRIHTFSTSVMRRR